MFTLLEKLHNQPKDARRRIGFFIAGSVTFVIFLFWIATLGSRFASEVEQNDEEAIHILTPLETVGESLMHLIDNTKENFSGLNF